MRFNNINMAGMYQRGLPPRIHLSARPLQRRAYNCAHELGHHVFGHGSSIDELREDAKSQPWDDPKEFLADTFAGFILMPIIGLRRAFSVRGSRGDLGNVAIDHMPDGRAVTLVIVGHRTGPALLHRQPRLGAVERLDWLFSSTDSTSEFAWEFLRRNPDYRSDYDRLRSTPGSRPSASSPHRSAARQWGLRFPVRSRSLG